MRRSASLLVVAALASAQSYVVQTVAGSYPLGDGGPALQALVSQPSSVAVDRQGNVLFTDAATLGVRAILQNGNVIQYSSFPAQRLLAEPDGNLLAGSFLVLARIGPDGRATIVAGNGTARQSGDGGQATEAGLGIVNGIARASDGTIYFSDSANHTVRKIERDGKISHFAGTPGIAGFAGDGGQANIARLRSPAGLALDSAGSVFISDQFNGLIRKVDKAGAIATVVGDGFIGIPTPGPALQSSTGIMSDLAVDAQDNLYILESVFGMVLRVSPTGTLSVLAGNGRLGFAGDGGPAANGQFQFPGGMALSGSTVYIADTGNDRIRRIASDTLSTIAGRSHFEGDGGPAVRALLNFPGATALDGQGNLYVSDSANNRIRRVAPNGTITTFAGTGEAGFSGDNAQAAAARLNDPGALVVDGSGNVTFADRGNNRIRRIAPDGVIRTIVGNGTRGDRADGSLGTGSQIGTISGLAIDATGVLYMADNSFHKIRRMGADNTVNTFVGTGTRGFAGDGGLATGAQLDTPRALTLDAAGNLLICDSGNGRVRRVTTGGTISTLAGGASAGAFVDGSPATAVNLGTIGGIATDAAGSIFVAAGGASRVFRISPDARLFTIAGNGRFDPIGGSMGDGGPATAAGLWTPVGMAINRDGDIWFADSGAQRVRKLSLNTPTQLESVSGNNQSGPAGQTLPNPVVVRLLGRAGVGVAGAVVNFAVTTGDARLGTTTATTDVAGRAGVSVTFGTRVGAVRVTATFAGHAPVAFDLTATTPPPPPPQVTRVVSAGGSVPPVTTLAPLGLARIIGGPFADQASTAEGAYRTVLGGYCVRVGGVLAAVAAVSSTEITIQVPMIGTGAVKLQVIRNCDQAGESAGPPFDVTLAESSPELFYWVRNADGTNPLAATDAETGAGLGAPGLVADREFTFAKPDQTVAITGTGFGVKVDEIPLGERATGPSAAVASATVRVGDLELPSESVLYAGAAEGQPGVDRLVFKLPADLADGDYVVTVTMGGNTSPAGGFLTVKKPE